MPRIYSEQTRLDVVRLRSKGRSWGEIKHKVRALRNVAAAQRIWKKYQDTNSVANQPGQGRPQGLTTTAKKRIDKELAKDPWLSPAELVAKLHLSVSTRTVERYRSENYRPVKGIPRPVLSEQNKLARLKWARDHLHDQFNDVVFTDEKSFVMFKMTRKAWVKYGREVPFRVQPSHPPRVEVLGGITRRGRTSLRFFDGRLTGAQHRQNVDSVLPSIRRLYPDSFRYLEDNDAAHTDRTSRRHLEALVPEIQTLPAQSPDFNAIEHLWSPLEARVAARRPQTVAELKKAVKQEWSKVTVDECNRIIDSVRPTLQAVIAAGGEHVTAAARRRYRA